MKRLYLTVLGAGAVLVAQSQSISPGGIYGAANVGQTGSVSLEWVLGSINTFNNLSTLPVKLIRFEGTLTADGSARLEWETEEEINNAGFEIEKSPNGISFTTIAFVDGNGTSQGKHTYEYVDNKLETTSYYRLKQLDNDGQFTTSRIISVVTENEKLYHFTAFPNPTLDGKITVTLPKRTRSLAVWDQNGKLVKDFVPPKTIEYVEIPASGTYILHMESVAGEKTLPIVRQ